MRAFFTAKMKMMFETLLACAKGLEDLFKKSHDNHEALDVKEIVSRFSTDIIGSCAFGIDCNSLKNPDSEFRKFGRQIFETPQNFIKLLRRLLFIGVPGGILNFFKIKRVDPELESFFMGVVKDTVSYREKNNVSRKDFLQLLLHLKNKGQVDKLDGRETNDTVGMTMNELAAQCFVFFAAGFETSSTTMTFALMELALNEDIQTKLRDEISTILEKYNGEVCYDAVMEMTYLDKLLHGKSGDISQNL